MTRPVNSPNIEHLSHPKYRADIDGLRAIAILSVVGYHAFPSQVGGGFVGVDIFFVISGFLISTIIFSNLQHNTFSFIEFYTRRIKRIFPGLLLVLITSFTLGWFVLFSGEFKQLGKHIASGAGFVSNFVLWNESGYFDSASETKPLLHLWSLGIEEQYYVIWPLLIWLTWERRINLLVVVMAIGTTSFILNILKAHTDSVADFYSPQTRFWELMVGSALAYVQLYPHSLLQKITYYIGSITHAHARNDFTWRNIQSLLGSALIIASINILTQHRSFPGWWAIMPTAGAALIISSGTRAWINRTVLSNPLLVWFGLISYPLYLWHWPLLSFSRIVEGGPPSGRIRTAAIAISIVLAWATYRFVETPIRLGKYDNVKTTSLLLLMITVGYVGLNSYSREGLPFRSYNKRFEEYAQSINWSPEEKRCVDIPFAYKKKDNWFCSLGKENTKPSIFAFGDSHALALLPALKKYATEKKINIQISSASGCPPLLGIQTAVNPEIMHKQNCQQLNNKILEYVKQQKIGTVLLIGRWTYYTQGVTRPNEFVPILKNNAQDISVESSRSAFRYGLKQTLEQFNKIGVKVYLVADDPQQLYSPDIAFRKSQFSGLQINDFSISKNEHDMDQAWVSDEFRNVSGELNGIIKFDDILCRNDKCPLEINGKLIYLDDDHLSTAGAMLVYNRLASILSKPIHPVSASR
ncbi:MAG: acyltransferase family protein [Burkholderiales bacterium]